MAEVLLKADAGELTLPEGQTTAVDDETYQDDNEGAEGEGQTLVKDDQGEIYRILFSFPVGCGYSTYPVVPR